MIRLQHRVEGGGTVPPPHGTTTGETPETPRVPTERGTAPVADPRTVEERHSGASRTLSGAGRDLTAVTGTTGTTPTVPTDARARFDRDLERFESLRRTSPDEARRMLPSLRSQASELLGNLPSQPRELLDLMRTVRGFYRHARDLATGTEAESFRSALAGTDDALRTVRTWLRSTLAVPSSGHATASQREAARLAVDYSRELAASVEAPAAGRVPLDGVNDLLAAEVIADYRSLIRLINLTSVGDMDDRARVDALSVTVRELYELRRNGLNDQRLGSALESEVSSMMRDCSVEIHNSFTFVDTPHAHDYVDQLLNDLIDSDDGELASHLSAEGLERFVREEGPHAAFSRSVRRLTSRIDELDRLDNPGTAGNALHGIMEEIQRLEANPDPNHLVDDLLAIRGLYRRLDFYSSSPLVRSHPDFASVRPGLTRTEGALRATRDVLRTGVTGSYSARERMNMAEMSIRISRGLGERTELITDYRRQLTLLNGVSTADLDGSSRLDAYARVVRELYDLRHDGLGIHELTSAESTQVTDLMREAATEIHNSLGYVETPGAHAVVDRLLTRIIDGDENALVTRLSARGLEEYAVGMHQAGEMLARARRTENPAEARTLMAESLRQYIALGAADQVHEVTGLILASVPADASDLSRLQVFTVLSSLLHGSGFPDETRVRDAGSALAQRLVDVSIEVEHVEYDVEDRPGGSRTIEVGRTMVNPRGRIETAERILAARGFYSAIGDTAAASGTDGRLHDLQDAMATQLTGTTDHRLRIELAGAIVGLDQVLVGTALAEADDAEDRTEIGTGLRNHLSLWQREIEAARDLPADFRLAQVRSVLSTAATYHSLTEGDRTAMTVADMDGVNSWAGRTISSLAETSVRSYVESHHLDPALTPSVMEDFRARVERAIHEGDSAWLNGINDESIGRFTELSQAGHVHLTGRHDPPTAEDLQHYLQASAVFARLGLPDRVRECLRPVIAHADGMREGVERANLYLNLGQIYQEAGMTEDANTMLGRIRELDGPGASRELHRIAEIVPAMQELNLGHLDRARELLRGIHGNPRAEGLLENIEGGICRRRALQAVDIARAVVADYAAWSRDRGSTRADTEEREIMAVFERAQRLVLAGRYGSIAEAMRHMDTTALFGFYDWSGGNSLDAFLRDTSDVSMTDDAFADRSMRLARTMFNDQRFSSAGAIASMLTGTPHTCDRARAMIESIPGEARWHSIFSITNIPIVGSILLNTGGDRSVMIGAARDFATLATFGLARGAALGAEAMFVTAVTEEAVASSLALQAAGFVVRSGTEAAVFTLSNMIFETVFTGRTDHWTAENFFRQFGSMLVTFGLCHGIGMAVSGAGRLAARSSWLGMAAEGAEAGGARVLRPGAQLVFAGVGYGATITGLTGVEYLNEALGLHPHEGDVPFFTRLLGSALMDAQMRLAGHITNAATGGALERMEASTRQRYLMNELMPVMERMGFERPRRMSEMSPESQVVMRALMARVAGGESVASLTERARSSEGDLSRTVQMILEVPPESAEGRRLRALLYSYSGTRGAEFAPGSERLSQEVGRIRMEAARSLRALGVSEGPEFTRLQNALVERMLSARVRETAGGSVRERAITAEEAAGLTDDARALRGPLEGVVREVLGGSGLRSGEGRALVGDLYVWMLETGRPISEVRTEAIRRLVAEATRPAGSEAPPSASGSGLTGSLGNMVRGASEETRRLGQDFGLGGTAFASHSVMERAVRPFLESLFNNPDSPPTAARIRARLSEVRSTLEALNSRIGETIPAEAQATLREEIFVEVLNGRMTREQALARIAEAAPERSGVRTRPVVEAEAPPLAARDGSVDIRPPRVSGSEAPPPAVLDHFSTSDGARYTVSATEVSSPALNVGEVALGGPRDLPAERSTPETRRRLAAAMAFARAQGIPRSERRFILTADNHVLVETEGGGTRRRIRLAEEVPDLTTHARPEPPPIPDLTAHAHLDPPPIPDLTAHARPEPPTIPDLTAHARAEPPPIPDLTAHARPEPPPIPPAARVPDLTAHAVPEVNVEGNGRLEGASLHVDLRGRFYGEVQVNDQTLIFQRADAGVRIFNFTGEPLRVRHADGTVSEPVAAARGPRGTEAGVAPGAAELRPGDVILLAHGVEVPFGGATMADTVRRATSVAPEGRSEEGTRRERRPRSEPSESPPESGTRRVRGPRREAPPPEETAPSSGLVDGRLQLDFRDRIYQTVSLDGATLTFGRRGTSTHLYNFTGGELRVRHADGTMSDPVAPARARSGEAPSPPGSIEVRSGDVIVLSTGREIPVADPLIRASERPTVPPPSRVAGGERPTRPVTYRRTPGGPEVVEDGAGGAVTRRTPRPGSGTAEERGATTRRTEVHEVRTPRGDEAVEASTLTDGTGRFLALDFHPGADGNPVAHSGPLEFTVIDGELHVRARSGSVRVAGREEAAGRWVVVNEGDTVEIGGVHYARHGSTLRPIRLAASDAPVFAHGENGVIMDNGDGTLTKVGGSVERNRQLDAEQAALAAVGALGLDIAPPLVGRPHPSELIIGRIPGRSLATLSVAERQAIPESAWTTLESALGRMRDAGIHHNDISAGNILWDGTTLRLIDFGLAELGVRSDDDLSRVGHLREAIRAGRTGQDLYPLGSIRDSEAATRVPVAEIPFEVPASAPPPAEVPVAPVVPLAGRRSSRRPTAPAETVPLAADEGRGSTARRSDPPLADTGSGRPPTERERRVADRPPPPEVPAEIPAIPRPPRMPDPLRLDREGAVAVSLMNATGEVGVPESLTFMEGLATGLEHGSPAAAELAGRIRADVRAVRAGGDGSQAAAERLTSVASGWGSVAPGTGGRPRSPSAMDATLGDALVRRLEISERGTRPPPRRRGGASTPEPLPLAAGETGATVRRPTVPPEGGGRSENTGVGLPPMRPGSETPFRGAPPFGAPPPPPEGAAPRGVVGGSVIESVRSHLVSHEGARPEDIHEVSIDQREIQGTMARLAAEVPVGDLPRTIHAIANIRRADGTHVIAVLTSEVSSDGRGGREVRTHLDQSTFHFSYRITETAGEPPRLRIILIEADPALRGSGVFNQATEAALAYAREHHPGVVMETDGVNLLSARQAGAMLPDAHFMTITDPAVHPIMRPLTTGLVDILERSEVLSASQATELREMIERLPARDNPERNPRAAELYNRFVEFVRGNYSRNRSEAPNEVAFLFQRVRSHEGVGFMSQDPFRRPLDADYIGALESCRVLTEAQATELREALGRVPAEGSARDTALRDLRTRFRTMVTERYNELRSRRREDATDVTSFVVGRLDTIPGATDRFLPGPYRGDLWVEGTVPGGEPARRPRRETVPVEVLPMAAGEDRPTTVVPSALEPLSEARASELRTPLRDALAAQLHDAWREPRRVRDESGRPTERFEPRWKRVRDPEWIANHRDRGEPTVRVVDGAVEVDIANTRYEDLPAEWQGENLASAEVATDEVLAAAREGRPLDDAFIERASATIHERWLERNREWAPAEQNRPYEELSESEREKDRVVIREAIRIYHERTGTTESEGAPRSETAPPSHPILASPERRAEIARVIRAEMAELPATVPDRRAEMERDLAAVEAGTASAEVLGRYAFQVVPSGERPSTRESLYLSFEPNASGERVTVREVSADGRRITVERADGSRRTFEGLFPGPHAFRAGDALSLMTLRTVAGGSGGSTLGTMRFTSPNPGVYTCIIGRGAFGSEGFFAIADSPGSGTISRRHAELRIEGGQGYLTDLGGPNGTRVWDAASRTWRRLNAGERYRLSPGETFHLGSETFAVERSADGNYRLRVHGEGRDIVAAPFSPAAAPMAGREAPEVVPVRPEIPSTVDAPLDFSRGAIVIGSFRGREVPPGGIRVGDRRISREHATLNPGPGGTLIIEARPDTRPPVLRGDSEVTPVWVRQGDRWVRLGSPEHPERSHSLRPGESFAFGLDPTPRVRHGRTDPDADAPMIFTVGRDGRRISSTSEFHDTAAPVSVRAPEERARPIRQRVVVVEEAPSPEVPVPPPAVVEAPPPPVRPAARFVASSVGAEGQMLPAAISGDPFAELAALPVGTEVFIASRGGRLVVERGASPETVVALRMDGRGNYRVRGHGGSVEGLMLMHTPEGGTTRREPIAGHTGAVLRPGSNQIAVGSFFLNFTIPGGGSAPRPGGSSTVAPLPPSGPIGRGVWSVSLPDTPRGVERSGLRLGDLSASTGFVDLYAGDPASGPSTVEPGVAQLTVADPLGGGGERRSLGRLERTADGWVLHSPRGRTLTLSRPNPARPHEAPREIPVTRDGRGTRLRDGDHIDFGGALQFEFRNGSLVPAITGDVNARLVVPERGVAAEEGSVSSRRPSTVDSLPPPPGGSTPLSPPVIRDAAGQEMTVPLTEPGTLVLGRVGDLRMGGDSVSGRHATLRMVIENGEMVYQVRDGAEIPTGWQPSLNGTYVNGERIRSGEWRTIRAGDRVRLGPTTEFAWHPPRTGAAPIGHGTLDFAQWQQLHPELLQARQFLTTSYLDGAPADRLEIPGRSAVFMEGAGRFVEGSEAGGREIIVWDRSRDTEVSGFLGAVEGEVRTRLGISRLDPASPTFERDLGRALDYFVGRLRETYRVPGENPRAAQARLDAFARAHAGESILVGEVLRARLPFCRHLTLLTQAFLTDMGLRGDTVRMQRGAAMGGAHVWNEVIIGGRRRIIEPTWAFYANGTMPVISPSTLEPVYVRETRAGHVE